MSSHDDASSQQELPASFIALFVPPGRIKPTESRQTIQARYEFCEDLAQLLTETALNHRHALHIGEDDVLQRILQGLLIDGAPVKPDEAHWVLRRLAELLNWEALPGVG
ncbi:MAG: ATPase with chaperone activity [Rubrivivax sp.]|nr:ATPase with chaperone activity [Rubrivivax sp.]